MVEYTSIKRNYELYASEYEEACLRVFRSGWYILGPELKQFEEAFAGYVGVKYCVGLNSGTDALILAVRALGIGPGDEVLVPAGTYIASVLGVTENGAEPVYVDSNEYLLMDATKLEALITPKTRAILPVHLYGQCCDMEMIRQVADRHGLKVIEDCAQCHGATWDGKRAGSFGDISCFSFYPTKPLGALGDGGCICTDDAELADKVRMLRNYGSRVKYHNESIGVNSRLDEVQAAALSVALKHLDECNDVRIRLSERYLENMKNSRVKLPVTNPRATNVYHLFPVLADDQQAFRDHLEKNGIGSLVHYPIPPYIAECYRYQGHTPEEYPNALNIAQHEVSLPMYAAMTEEEADLVIEAVNSYGL